MKKLLFGILTFLGIGLSFCSAENLSYIFENGIFTPSSFSFSEGTIINGYYNSNSECSIGVNGTLIFSSDGVTYNCDEFIMINPNWFYCQNSVDGVSYPTFPFTILSSTNISFSEPYCNDSLITGYFDITPSSSGGGNETGTSSSITVYYNNGNSSTGITCDGTQAIEIQGLSTITSTNTFTPYFNISYIDEDNQSLIESYSKDILYLENGQFKKTYTGNNDRILTYQGSSDSTFTGYVPVFDFTGDTIVNTGNVFNNFSDNALKVLLSNIPSYIQYITIFAILVFLFSFIRRFKRKS